MSIKDTDKGYKALIENVFGLAEPEITVGIHKAEGSQAHKGSSASIADIASFNEYGLGIPERSFLRAWFDANLAKNKSVLASRLRQVIKGKISKDQALGQLGASFVSGIQARISGHIPPPNADSTIARKGSSTPLIDTGTMRASITYEVKK